MTLMLGLTALSASSMVSYAAIISSTDLPNVTSFVPSIKFAMSGCASAAQPLMYCCAMSTACHPECPSWPVSKLPVEELQPWGLLVMEPTKSTSEVRDSAASMSQTRARQQVISVMESPKGTGCVSGGWVWDGKWGGTYGSGRIGRTRRGRGP